MRVRPAVVTAGIVCLLLAGVAGFAAPAAAATIDVDHTLAQTDAEGEVDVETRLGIPSGMANLELRVPEGSDVYESEGFTRIDDRTYRWTHSTNSPSLQYAYDGNVTIDRSNGPQHLYAVTEEWAIVRTPSIGLQWTGPQSDVDVAAHVDGQGVAGRHITYLGPYEETTREGHDQRFRLVEAAAADLEADREAVLDNLEYASERLRIGEKDDEVIVFVVPTANVDWGATGVQRGDSDMWVRDGEGLANPKNTWIHEYVHTLQEYERTEETRWTIEGMADYYAALLSFEQGAIDYEAFGDRMADGRAGDVSDVELVDPGTWASNSGNYDKGALVFAHLDRRLRTETDTSIGGVVAGFNREDQELTHEQFLDAVEAAGGSDLRAEAARYTETTAAPSLWSRQEHVEAFGGPDVRYRFERFAASGPYREATLDGPRLVTGETLTTTVLVENAGTQEAEYDAAFTVDGQTSGGEQGTLAPGEETTLTFERVFESAGEYDLSVGTASATAIVEEPAAVEVTDLAVEPSEAARGERVTLRATVESGADRPAAGEVAFVVNGETVATEPARVGSGSTTVETTTTFDAAGEYEVTAGDHAATVTVTDETVTPGVRDTASATPGETTPTSTDGPGFAAAPAVVALAAVGLFVRRRR
jgi:PGF-CTERM protein